MSTYKRERQASTRRASWAFGFLLLASCALAVQAAGPAHSQRQAEALKADSAVELPVPTKIRHRTFTTNYSDGVKAPIRRLLKARIPAEVDDVLAFYRTEFAKRGWQEVSDGADIAAEHVVLNFNTPDGPAILKLDRAANETLVDLVQRNAAAAAEANFLPAAGQARLIFGYLAPDTASLAINDQTIKIEGGMNHPQTLDLPPGTYSYQLRVPGHPVRTDSITVAAGEAWALRLGADDKKPEQIY